MSNKEKILNIAVIAHVDAGKSTLVDAFLRQSDVFRDNEEVVNCIMDSNDLERERGITIYSKNCSVIHNGVKINIVDTPGHADFSSEVERIIRTVDTVILLVDASEGPMPQTRFVLSKALEIGLKPILLINKIDKKDQRAEEVVDEVYELFLDLNANDEQLDFPILYGVAREGRVQYDLKTPSDNIDPLFDTILKHCDVYPDMDEEPLQMQVSALAYDEYIGRLGIGRLYSGVLKQGQQYIRCNQSGLNAKESLSKLFVYKGLSRTSVQEAHSGDIVVIAGMPDISIGDTICTPKHKFKFEGIPTFAPEHFARIRNTDTMKRKQFVKGVEQIAQEGAIQIFTEIGGSMEEIIVGVVGVLQFEVLEYRLKNEYNVNIKREPLGYQFIRWIDNEEIDLYSLNLSSDTKRVQDLRGKYLLLFSNQWGINWATDKNKELILSEFSKN